jgi:hypothetical protein
MTTRTSAYEFLGRRVADGCTSATTRVTATSETYDDQGFDGLAVPVSMQTTISRNDTETYDDQGVAGLGFPDNVQDRPGWIDSHVISTVTKVDNETYDDSGSLGLGLPHG